MDRHRRYGLAGHLLTAGWPLAVYTRSRAKAELLLAEGAKWAENPCALATCSDVVFSIAGYPEDVEEVMLGTALPKAALSAI
ncbi:hypothetical protein AGMMS49974_10090 [Deltaproteobacteria bacterium]|nr:hypothetical protein AGMMS49974_10090 [Deltaproteobacteria bacterium]